MGDKGDDYIRRWEAKDLMTEMLADYERDVVNPRHRETQGSLDEIKNIVREGRGMLRLGSWAGIIIGLVWITIQIVNAVKH